MRRYFSDKSPDHNFRRMGEPLRVSGYRSAWSSASPKAIRCKEFAPSERGQSLVEMSLMMIVLILILAGVLDLGRLFFTFLALQDAAGEGAAYGSIHPSWVDGSLAGAADDNPNNITYRVKHESPSGLIDWSSTTVTVSAPNPTPGNQIRVTVSYNYTLLTPFVGAIVGSQTLPLSATATQSILRFD